jgi:hypothetical protein
MRALDEEPFVAAAHRVLPADRLQYFVNPQVVVMLCMSRIHVSISKAIGLRRSASAAAACFVATERCESARIAAQRLALRRRWRPET